MTATSPVHYKTVRINDLDIFYREAGPQTAPVILLLHGFPTSSNMFRNLIPRLAGSFHVVAPDYPGFGQSSMPEPRRSLHDRPSRTLANMCGKVRSSSSGSARFALYVMDYGRAGWLPARSAASGSDPGARSYRMATHTIEGLREFWDPIKKILGGSQL